MPRVRVPATTANLGPGFDALGLALELYDYVSIEEAPELEITVQGEGENSIPRGPDNIAYRAAAAVYARVGRKVPGFKIAFENHIPVARGLGSSAAAVVAGLVGANALLGYPLPQEELVSLAARLEGHPDNVAPALLGGLVVVVLNGQQVYYQRLDPPPGLSLQVAIPHFTLSTRVSRGVLPAMVPVEDAVFNLSRTALLIAAAQAGDLELMGKAMEDRLHQPYRLRLIPGMPYVFEAALKAGALAVTLSGSGPAVIAFCRGSLPKVGKAMKEAFEEHGVKCEVKELKPASQGAILC
ncbi:homoserine kinase [Thermanaeromonas toyohensis ToBE]|uniref:Homoserine kinase n=1 Tax=Thermanaeromonas toyohensis ToBE TaxID=698762 RepID=A0A1W1VYE9_9FIRM|nr:homoserine kinase [Thermanaeromonas toyohensis]SMB98280.1 homoserine kinase [Thermanaeromonas toyohensis ToBE]